MGIRQWRDTTTRTATTSFCPSPRYPSTSGNGRHILGGAPRTPARRQTAGGKYTQSHQYHVPPHRRQQGQCRQEQRHCRGKIPQPHLKDGVTARNLRSAAHIHTQKESGNKPCARKRQRLDFTTPCFYPFPNPNRSSDRNKRVVRRFVFLFSTLLRLRFVILPPSAFRHSPLCLQHGRCKLLETKDETERKSDDRFGLSEGQCQSRSCLESGLQETKEKITSAF